MDRLVWRFRPWTASDGGEALDSLVMERRDRLANLGFFAAAAIVWVLVGLVVTTRDPVADPGAGFIGAALIGLAIALTLVPLLWLAIFSRHRMIAYRGDWLRAIRRSAWVGHRRRGPDRAAHPGPARAADRAVHDRAGGRRRGDAVRGTLTTPVRARARLRAQPIAARRSRDDPQRHPPGPAVRRRQGRARRGGRSRPGRDPRPVAPHPRQPRAGLRGGPGGGLDRRDPGAPRLRGRASGRPPGDGDPGRPTWWPWRRRPADRHPRRVRRAARARPRLRAQHDGRVGRRRRDRPRRDRRRAARRDRLPRDPGRGARQRQAVHDRRRPVRRDRRGAAVPPVRPEPRRDATRWRPRTSTSSSPASRRTPRRIRGWAGTRSTR